MVIYDFHLYLQRSSGVFMISKFFYWFYFVRRFQIRPSVPAFYNLLCFVNKQILQWVINVHYRPKNLESKKEMSAETELESGMELALKTELAPEIELAFETKIISQTKMGFDTELGSK